MSKEPLFTGEGSTSFYGWGMSLQRAPEAFAQLAGQFAAIHEQAQTQQPAHAALTDEIGEIARILRTAEEKAGAWYTTWRNLHAPDVEAVEDPRKGSNVESRADVARAMGDDTRRS